MAQAYFYPSTKKAETGNNLWVQGQPGPQSKIQDNQGYRETLSQKEKNNLVFHVRISWLLLEKGVYYLLSVAVWIGVTP